MNEELNRAFEEISDDLLNEAAGYQKKRFPWVRSVVGVVGVIIAWVAIWSAFDFKPPFIVPDPSEPIVQDNLPIAIPTTPTTPTTPSTPSDFEDLQLSQPTSYLRFKSMDEISGFFQAATWSDQDFTDYVYGMGFYLSDTARLRNSAQQLQQSLGDTALPCLDGNFTMYYYYESNNIELFIDQGDIRYHFLISTSDLKVSGTPTDTVVSIAGTSFMLLEKDGRLYGLFEYDGVNYYVSIFTDDLDQVDFSSFTLELCPL